MHKFLEFIKTHPVIVAVVAIGVLVVMFWPRSGNVADPNASQAAIADTIAQTAAASTQLQLSHDQVQAIGLQSAAAQAINANDNAAAVTVATLQAQSDMAQINAALTMQQNDASNAVSLGKVNAAASALQAVASVLPQTQANSIAGGQYTDPASFQLGEMFKNLLNSFQGIAASSTLVTVNGGGTTATTLGSNGQAVSVINQSVFDGADKMRPTYAASTTNVDGTVNNFGTQYGQG